MSEKFTCPYCEVIFVLDKYTHTVLDTAFDITDANYRRPKTSTTEESELILSYYKCPNCHLYSVDVSGIGTKVSEINLRILPFGKAKQLPEYIPRAIREDYKESCLIKDLSPKASATLSRRCLQGMIRDFWGISGNSLFNEINQLKDKIPVDQWGVIDAVRKIGNIGAHMENDINKIIDINPIEAEKLIELIEFLLVQWYVNKRNIEQLYTDITNINDEKEKQKKSNNK